MSKANINVKKVKYGKTERYKFGKIDEVLEVPDLIEVQKESYNQFITKGIRDVLRDFSPITDTDNLNRSEREEDKDSRVELHFLEHSISGTPKYSEAECKVRDATYSLPLKVKVRLVYKETGEIVDQEVFMGDVPLMTQNGSFIINGAERAIVSQLVRSPGVYCKEGLNKTGNYVVTTSLMPARGEWIEWEEDTNGVLWVHVARSRKMIGTIFLRALGLGTDEQLLQMFHNHPTIQKTIEKDFTKSEDEALVEISKRLRPGEVINLKAIKKWLEKMFYNTRRYDITRVGRHKYDQKLSLANRIVGLTSVEDVISPEGEVFVTAGEVINEENAWKIQNAGINEVWVATQKDKFCVRGNGRVNLKAAFGIDGEPLEIDELVHYATTKELLKNAKNKQQKVEILEKYRDLIMGRHLMLDDILASVNYHLSLGEKIGTYDDVDHLGNRRVKAVGELLQNQFFIGMARLERVISERMQAQNLNEISPSQLINVRPVSAAMREFFGSSQMSQFMDQVNPIASLTHKRKLTTLGPGGLSRERAGFDVRDVHYTHYGRLCPNETPEGQNIGLINSLATYAKINKYGFIEAPYRKVTAEGVVTDEVQYMTADEEEKYVVAQANEPLTKEKTFANKRVVCRKRGEIVELPREQVNYMDVSPKELVSIATTLIPFIDSDNATRAMMASNQQRQAVPLLKTEAPIVASGMEHKIAVDSGAVVVAKNAGVVRYVSADKIIVTCDNGSEDEYELVKFVRSNERTCMRQRPICSKGDKVKKGDVLADGPATCNGELSVGKNILVAFMPWEGYNFEDAILISEKLVQDDTLTSVHIEQYEIDARDTKLGPEDITRDIPNVGEDQLKDLDENGIIRIGAEVVPGDILVGKVTPKGETELTPEERLLRAIFGEKAREVRDTSLRVQHGEGGVVIDVKVFTRENKDELQTGVNKLVRVYIAQKRKMSVGDKMSGRHGNKGVVSRILPEADMPFLPDGTPIQIVLNPLGVPSRMNIGQLFETHLSLVAKALDWKVATPVFDGAEESEIQALLEENGFPKDGKMQLFDGRTGEPFENRATVGYMYMLKLNHLVDDKVHARSTGPYSLVTQQPLGGKAQMGGQRFGEMEVWALEAYGAANILQEMLTVKSDDIVGRQKTYESIVKSENVSEPGIPESFKVLIKELQALALDVKVLTEDKEEIALKDLIEDDRDFVEPLPAKKQQQQEVDVDFETTDAEPDDVDKDDEDTVELMGADSLFEFDEDLGDE